ncbi:hypothetical protein YC2023_055312 [Brassica napus]
MANHLQSKINPATDELSHPNNLSLPRRSVSNRVLNDFTNCCMTPTTTVKHHGLGVEEIVNHVMNSWEQATGNKRH